MHHAACDYRCHYRGEKVRLGIRPEHIHMQVEQGDFSLTFQSEVVERLGNSTYLFGNYCGKEGFKVHVQGDKAVALYEDIKLGIHLSDCHLFNQMVSPSDSVKSLQRVNIKHAMA